MLTLTLYLLAARPVLVTVDDLPIASASLSPAQRAKVTASLLSTLKRHHIRAVGLVTWSNVRDDGEKLLEQWLTEGHELGNHTYSHLDYTKDADAFFADSERGQSELNRFLEAHHQNGARFFRFPFLREGETLEKLRVARAWLEKTHQRNLPVTLDTQDWSFEQPFLAAGSNRDAVDDVHQRYQDALRSTVRYLEAQGDAVAQRETPQILLLHANAVGAHEWHELFTWLEKTGHRFATADEVLADASLGLPHEYVGLNGSSLWLRVLDGQRTQKAFDEVKALLLKQAQAWSKGDVVDFCSVYADDTTFISPSGITRGKAAVLARYQKKYPDAKAMGTLTLEPLEFRAMKGTEISFFGDAVPSRVHAVTVVAKWSLSYPDKPAATGLTQLVLTRTAQGWAIVQDASM